MDRKRAKGEEPDETQQPMEAASNSVDDHKNGYNEKRRPDESKESRGNHFKRNVDTRARNDRRISLSAMDFYCNECLDAGIISKNKQVKNKSKLVSG